jgi:hypothetical protein
MADESVKLATDAVAQALQAVEDADANFQKLYENDIKPLVFQKWLSG